MDYKCVQDTALKCFIDYGELTLPVSVGKIATHYNIKIIFNSKIDFLTGSEEGKILTNKSSAYIIVKDTVSKQEMRFTAAHEIGHYILGHLEEGYDALDGRSQEITADLFAECLLMPAVVLWKMGIKTPQEIAKVCDVTLQAAEIRAERLKDFKFEDSPLERRVLEMFIH